MNAYEEELQKKLEGGEAGDADGLDVKAYQAVFRALQKDPGYDLPSGFAERVVARVVATEERAVSMDYFWFAAGILFLMLSFVATVVFTGVRFDLGFLKVMAEYKGLVIFGAIFIAVLNWLDARLLKEKKFQH